jgi:transposase
VGRDKKRACRKQAWIVFEDECGASLTPAVRRTWAPKGKTPILRHCFNRKKISMAAALAYRSDGGRARLYFQTTSESYNEDKLMDFLRQLHRHFPGQQVMLLWDGLPGHHGRKMKEYIAGQGRWLEVERLPAYAPELNPVEKMWANLKGTELANRCDTSLDDVEAAAYAGSGRLSDDQPLLFSFLKAAGLTL